MEENIVINRLAQRLLPELKKTIESAYRTGKMDGERVQFFEQNDKLTSLYSRVLFTRIHSGVELSLWIVVPNEFLTVYPWIFKSFSKETLDLIFLQMGMESLSKDIEDNSNDSYIVDDLKRQQRIIQGFFWNSGVKVEPGFKPMTYSDYDYVWKELSVKTLR